MTSRRASRSFGVHTFSPVRLAVCIFMVLAIGGNTAIASTGSVKRTEAAV